MSAPTSNPTVDAAIVAALPAYEIGEELGRGGCGIVLSGTHRKLRRRVAIKQIPQAFADDVSVRRRFAAEARLMSAIDHPHVMPVYDYVEVDDICLLVGEYLPGGTVGDRFAKQGFDPQTSIAVVLSCAAGLHAAHGIGVLHRDVKPGNLIFAANGSVKLTDFGIAKILGGTDTLVTRAGDVIGTPAYIAPEQVRGEELTPATDVYALGTMLYELISGTMPFPVNQSPMTMLYQHAYEPPTPLRDVSPEVPEQVAEVVMRALATHVADRYATAEDMGVALGTSAMGSWGCEWLSATGIPVVAPDTVMAAMTGRNSAPRAGWIGTPPPHSAVPPVHDSPATAVLAHGRPSRRQPTRPITVVRPSSDRPPEGIRAADVAPDELQPARDVVAVRSPLVPALIASVLAAGTIACAVVGIGGLPAGADLAAHGVTIADANTAASPLSVDVSPGAADRLRLSEEIAGIPVAERSVVVAPQGAAGILIEAPLPDWVLPTLTPAVLRAEDGGHMIGEQRFALHGDQPRYLTAFAAATLLVTLFSLAHLESAARSIRRGHSRVGSVLGFVLSALAVGICLPAWAWVGLGAAPTRATLIATVALSGSAAIAAALAALRVGTAWRYRRRTRVSLHTNDVAVTGRRRR